MVAARLAHLRKSLRKIEGSQTINNWALRRQTRENRGFLTGIANVARMRKIAETMRQKCFVIRNWPINI
ncbi:MAG: hypothetical protein CMJ58_19005 [Planctomycetaceae bacterium]|nr:hypothetical protein [Planctomycetaceae bacterium]